MAYASLAHPDTSFESIGEYLTMSRCVQADLAYDLTAYLNDRIPTT